MSINYTTIEQIEAASTFDLVQFYNSVNPEKPIKKFADRKTAVKRCVALITVDHSDVEENPLEGAIGLDPEVCDESASCESSDADEQKPEKVKVLVDTGRRSIGDRRAQDQRANSQRRSASDLKEVEVEVGADPDEKPKFVWPFPEPSAKRVVKKNPDVTKAQASILRSIARSEFSQANGREPENYDDVGLVWASSVLDGEQKRKTFQTLVDSGFTYKDEGVGDDACVGLTEKGYEEYKTLPDGYGIVAKKVQRHISSASNAAGVAASWTDSSVAEARKTRNGVFVTVNGKTTEHKSTRDAFREYRLLDSKHIKFRGILKASKKAEYVENGISYIFTLN